MEGERRQGGDRRRLSLTGLNSTTGDKERRRRWRMKGLLHCHTFGRSHRKRQNRRRRRKDKWKTEKEMRGEDKRRKERQNEK